MKAKNCEQGVHFRFSALLSGFVFLLAASASSAQTVQGASDNIPPIIELEELIQGVADISQVFTVQIVEETELSEATLHYRRAGQQPFISKSMTPLGASGYYSVSIATDPVDLRPIEYYVEAIDATGNRTVSGFAFDPYERKLTPATAARSPVGADGNPVAQDAGATQRAQIEQSQPFYKNRWFQIGLGVLAAGVIVSSLDSGGEDSQTVSVGITLE